MLDNLQEINFESSIDLVVRVDDERWPLVGYHAHRANGRQQEWHLGREVGCNVVVAVEEVSFVALCLFNELRAVHGRRWPVTQFDDVFAFEIVGTFVVGIGKVCEGVDLTVALDEQQEV